MKPLLIAIMAGIPYRIGDEFVSKFRRRLPDASIISWLSLEFSESYSNSYARRLYEHVAAKLKSLDRSDRYDLLLDANLVLLYVDKEDGQESVIFSRFGVEALIIPMRVPNIRNLPLITGNQRQNAVNTLVSEGERAIKRAWRLLPVIAEEVTNRDSKTCLLLPRNNFGEKVNRVLSCVRNASFARVKADQFKRDIDVVSQMLPTARDGKRTYFVGRSGMVFNLNPAVERSGLPFLGAIVSPSARPEAVGARVDGPVVGLRGTSSALPPGFGASDPLRSTAPHF